MPDVPNKESKFEEIKKAKEEREEETGIRTMAEDISKLSGKEPKKKAPERKAPVVTPNFLQRILKREEKEKKEIPKKKLEQKKKEEKKEEEILKKKLEQNKKEEELRKQEEEKKKRELVRLKEEEERKKETKRLEKGEVKKKIAEKKLRKKEEEERRKEEERQRILKEREERRRPEKKKVVDEKIKKKIEKKLKIPSPPEPILPEEPRGFTSPIPGVFILILFLSAISGLFFLFKNYQVKPSLPPSPPLPEAQIANLVSPPPTPTHKECQGLKCIVVEGEGPDLCKTDKDCRPVLPPIALDISEELKLSSLSPNVFIPLLDKKFQKQYPPGTFIEIIPKYKGKLLTISQLFQALDLHPPKKVKNNLETYTLYLYSQKELFVQKRRNRLGISFRIKEGKKGIVRTAMSQWEKVLPTDFYKVHTLWKRGKKASPNFIDNYYKGIHIRYTNFPVPDLSIDWATKKDILMITTSRETMWRTIDIIK